MHDLQEHLLQDHLDLATLQELRDVLGADFPVLVATFVADSEARIAAIHAAQAAGNSAALREAAHSLRGSSLNIGANRLAAASSTLEEFAKAGDVAGAAGQIPVLESTLRTVVAHLTRWAGQ